jgi:hypothetical protein
MKKILIIIAIITLFASNSFARDVWVDGYTKRDGTRVQGHYRTSPDRYKNNNYSTYGNRNPYTGKSGTRTYGGSCSSTVINC